MAKAKKSVESVKRGKQQFSFPTLGKTIFADSIEEATAIANGDADVKKEDEPVEKADTSIE